MNITMIGGHARRWLEGSAGGRVAAVFEHGCYLGQGRGPMLFLASRKRNPGPLSLLHAGDDWECRAAVKVGDRWRCDASALQVGDARFGLDGAAIWVAPDSIGDWTPRRIEEGMRLAAELVDDVDTGILMPLVLERRSRGATPLESRLAARAAPAIRALRRWLSESLEARARTLEVPDDAGALLGLGPGLTPAGDDFVIGMLIALHGLRLEGIAGVLADWVRRNAPTRTNEISMSHLLAACEGQASAPLHAALNALASANRPQLRHSVRQLAGLGHSSGWDAFSGVLTVCRCVSGGSCDAQAALAFGFTSTRLPRGVLALRRMSVFTWLSS
jgi:hypothetical protein